MMKKICDDAKVYPHNLRYLFAFDKIEKNLAYLDDIPGHLSIETISVYTKTSIQECQSTIDMMGLI